MVRPVGHCVRPSVPQIWLLPQTGVWTLCARLRLQTRVSVPGAAPCPVTPCWRPAGSAGAVGEGPCTHVPTNTSQIPFSLLLIGRGQGCGGDSRGVFIGISLVLTGLHTWSCVRGPFGRPPVENAVSLRDFDHFSAQVSHLILLIN